jgi:hypothetical protein
MNTKKILSLVYTGVILMIIFTSTFLFNSCNCGCGVGDQTDVPLSVLNKANDFIIKKTGEVFFKKYFSPDFGKTEFTGSQYKMVYSFFMPDKPYVNSWAEFYIDTTGVVDTTKEISGIPDFINNPASCKFDINAAKAIQIAKNNGLETGIKPWKTGFLWDNDLNQYVWHVLSIFNESGKDKDYKANGKDMLIDPNTGLVLKTSLWNIPKKN